MPSEERCPTPPLRCVLTIGGLDPSGGAGLTADARAVAAFGAHALPVITAVVAQNTCGVRSWEAVTPTMLAAQLDVLLEDVHPDAVKIGMLPGVAEAEVVASQLRELRKATPALPIIIDPVFAPSNGPAFSDEATIAAIAGHLLPLCEVVTPNVPEAARLSGLPPARDAREMQDTCRALHARFGSRCVLLKGGHLAASEREGQAIDLLFDGVTFHELRAPWVQGYETRGTGCLLASALAAQRAQGVGVLEAASHAKEWLQRALVGAKAIGKGRRVATGATHDAAG